MLALGAGFFGLNTRYLPSGGALVGTRVLEEALPQGQSVNSWLSELKWRWGGRPLRLTDGPSSFPVTFEQLGISLDTDQLRSALLQRAASGSFFERLRRSFGARRGEERVIPKWRFDSSRAQHLLEEMGPGLARGPEDARVDLENHRKVSDVPGRELDVASTLAPLPRLINAGIADVPLRFRPVPATIRLDALTGVDVSQVLSTFETDFKGHAGRRKINIARAAKYLDGALIAPGEIWSFNRVVGPRTLERGFVQAPVIVEDVMEPGIGGGVCQVATTLFAAAVHGDLAIVRRRSHSRPSGYAPLGLDATVIDHEVDLRVKNPFPVPLLIHAYLPTETSIRVELLGHALPYKVEHAFSVTERHNFTRRVKFTAEVAAPKRKQRGHYGYDVVSVVTTRDSKGHTQRYTYPSTYYPVPEVYWVPPAFDLSKLPPLPEGADQTVVGDTPLDPPEGQENNVLAEPPS
ncbi:MAG TPA: VanW family protein [Polyangiaceae bacterium]|nr:VanW family protein [Polyangiaceae bacterium]